MDIMTPEQRHGCMSHIHSKDTGPEVAVRRELFRRGFRYRVNDRKLPGSPDLVLVKYRTAIFVNGCFWHGHKGCPKYVLPKSNVEFWTEKISRNQERDLVNIQRLESLAWSVIIVWECELSKQKIDATVERIINELSSNRDKWSAYCQRRKADRDFSNAERMRQKEIRAVIEEELSCLFDIPEKIKRLANKERID